MVKASYCSKELCQLLEKKGIEASHVRQYEKGGSWYNKYTLDIAMKWLREVHGIHLQAEDKCFCETSHDGMRVKKLYWHWCPNVTLLRHSKVHEDGLVSINYKMDGIYADSFEQAIEESIKRILDNT